MTVQPCVIPAAGVSRLMNTLGARSEMKDLIHQAPVRRSLLTTCAINYTNERCQVGLERKTTKHFIIAITELRVPSCCGGRGFSCPPGFAWAAPVVRHGRVVGDGYHLQSSHRQAFDGRLRGETDTASLRCRFTTRKCER